eukprot:RCo048157
MEMAQGVPAAPADEAAFSLFCSPERLIRVVLPREDLPAAFAPSVPAVPVVPAFPAAAPNEAASVAKESGGSVGGGGLSDSGPCEHFDYWRRLRVKKLTPSTISHEQGSQ